VETLTRTRGNISRAALELGISRPTMHDLLHKHQLAGKGIGRHWRPSMQPTAMKPAAGGEM
jgi:DNA-binding NtrC family response regulator